MARRKAPDRYAKVKVGTYSDGSPKYITNGLRVFYYHLEKETGIDLTTRTMQGCFHAGDLSANTHAGADVVDTPNYGVDFLNAIKDLGGFGWIRTALDSADFGGSNEHTHWGIKGSRKMDPSAKRQEVSYLAGDNGLVSNKPDRYKHRSPRKFRYHRAYFAMVDEIELGRQLSRAQRIRKTTRRGSPLWDSLTRFIRNGRVKLDH